MPLKRLPILLLVSPAPVRRQRLVPVLHQLCQHHPRLLRGQRVAVLLPDGLQKLSLLEGPRLDPSGSGSGSGSGGGGGAGFVPLCRPDRGRACAT